MEIKTVDYQFASIVCDLASGELRNPRGDTQRLSPILLKLLRCFLESGGSLVLRTELFDRIWPNQILSDDVLTRAVSDLRGLLAKLEPDTKFIETLPKRGYRWLVLVTERRVGAQTGIPVVQPEFSAAPFLSNAVVGSLPKRALAGVAWSVAGLVLALIFLWAISLPKTEVSRIVVLPVVAPLPSDVAAAQAVNEQLLALVRKQPTLEVLSRTALDTRPKTPFPYFAQEFGAQVVLESEVRVEELGLRMEVNLLDARTGFELRSLHFNAETVQQLEAQLAKTLGDVQFYRTDIN